jgi:[protein-PII] uridylyltransferase
VSWAALRQRVADQEAVVGEGLLGALTDLVDQWLTGLFEAAVGPGGAGRPGLALCALGSYGRRELCLGSDLDLLLLHEGGDGVEAVAEALWYPIWDAAARLDHAVRRPEEALAVAREDLRVQLGLLDLRLVAGDPALAARVGEQARAQWAASSARLAPLLADQAAERRERLGDLAFLLEPDLKEASGGLRDAEVLLALGQGRPEVADVVDLAALGASRRQLLAVRAELHRRHPASRDRLVLQAQDDVAAALGLRDADALMAQVAEAGRTIAVEGQQLWQRVLAASGAPRRRWSARRGGPSPERVEPGVAILPVTWAERPAGREVALDPDQADLADPSLALRLAAVAAERRLPIQRASLARLAAAPRRVPIPWPATLRQSLVRVLAAGAPAVDALEALERYGLLRHLLPEWRAVANKPQRNAYHRYTVDRHLLETAARAAARAERTARPDLVLLGCLLHDIGKGYPGDHVEVGAELARAMGERMGLPPEDQERLGRLVRLHLLLPDVATRRDLGDPATIAHVAAQVEDRETLEALACLAEADGRATGPAAWTPWKAGLVRDLVAATAAVLRGEPPSDRPVGRQPTPEERRLAARARDLGRVVLHAEPPVVVVAAPDQPGLLAAVTGVLSLQGLDVRSADVSAVDGVALERFVCEPVLGRWPSWDRLADEVEAARRGRLPLAERLAERARTYGPGRRPAQAYPPVTSVELEPGASASATVVEVRTADRPGLLWHLTRALAELGLDVVAARAQTLGAEAVDVFYVVERASGQPIRVPSRQAALRSALVDALQAP